MITCDDLSRRRFLYASGSLVLGSALLQKNILAQTNGGAYPRLKKAVQWNNLPKELSEIDRCKLARDCGFDGIEIPPITKEDEAKRIWESAQKNQIEIHSIIYGGWDKPLSHPDPAIVEKGKSSIIQAIDLAKQVGANTVLLVPAVVNEQVRYQEAWERSQKNIKDLIPYAEKNQVIIAVENVWNKFLLSPLEFRQYIDEINSPFVRAYFDMANVVIFGYPQDWIRTLGNRIVKVHIKDFKRNGYQWCNLPYEGDIDFAEVRLALQEVGYTGWITEEFPSGDEKHLKELSRRMDLFIQGAKKA